MNKAEPGATLCVDSISFRKSVEKVFIGIYSDD